MASVWKKILEDLRNEGISGLFPQILPFSLALEIEKLKKPTIFVAASEESAFEIAKKTSILLNSERQIHHLPALIEDVYGPLSPHPSIINQRASTISSLLNLKQKIVIVSPLSLLFKVPKKGLFGRHHFLLEKGATLSLLELKSSLWTIGYKRNDLVEGSGEYSIRGNLLDIFPPEFDFGLRVEFFGDTVEDIRYFDPSTQRSFSSTEEKFLIRPLSEVIKSDDVLFNLKEELKNNGDFGKIRLSSLEKNGTYPTLEIEARFDDRIFCSLNEFLGSTDVISLTKGAKNLIQNERLRLYEDFKRSFKPSFISPSKLFAKCENIEDKIKGISSTKEIPVERIDLIPSRLIENLKMLDEKVKKGYKVVVTFSNKGTIERIKNWVYKEVSSSILTDYSYENFAPAFYFIVSQSFDNICFPSIKWAVVSEKDLLGRSIVYADITTKKRDVFFESLRDLKTGDYVVHIEHGIGLYKGVETIKRFGREEDFVHIEYKGKDKLLLPVERLDLIQKYKGPEGVIPQLDKLGTLSFKKRKEKAKKAIQEVAEDLLKVYASRKKAECTPIFCDPAAEADFENLFPYDLTVDQKKVLEEVKKDLESTSPMDRIICGDVGFGKTEIAIRAAFKVVNGGFQVVILCPTTVLALQHFENFKERFSLFPVNIAMLSRLVPIKKQKEIIKKIKEGTLDIIIGTHRILSKDVKIPKLRLFIVDEEQRFGVMHKEKIKKTKPDVHFLTLSATPIPRTLQMGLSTIIDMSLIETPPKDRLSIDTVFSVYDSDLVKSAIRNELKRKGQIFYLFNRVEDIEKKSKTIKELVPEAKIIVSHGQLYKRELEKRILNFYNHQADILLSTTIIENGIDIPKANTLIVENAQNFGLAELYQIRGRIGRSNIPSYAYFLIPPREQISQDAVKRLKTLEEFTQLGSGFRIAAKDLELRGAGTLLGKKQSGHIESVGFELYMRLLEEVVSELKGCSLKETFRTELRLLSLMSIPKNYIESDNERLGIYRELSLAETQTEIEKVEKEIRDRFGELPEEVKLLLEGTRVRIKAESFLIEKIIEEKGAINVYFGQNSPVDPNSFLMIVKERKICSIKENVVKFALFKNERGLDFLKTLFSKLKFSGKT